jgi:hypothetical protein
MHYALADEGLGVFTQSGSNTSQRSSCSLVRLQGNTKHINGDLFFLNIDPVSVKLVMSGAQRILLDS